MTLIGYLSVTVDTTQCPSLSPCPQLKLHGLPILPNAFGLLASLGRCHLLSQERPQLYA